MDKRIVVAIDAWDTDSMYPSGHYVRTLGVIGDKDTETVREWGGSGGERGRCGELRWAGVDMSVGLDEKITNTLK